jgi:serine/threonine-protein phosphatase 2A regulatory subunit B'
MARPPLSLHRLGRTTKNGIPSKASASTHELRSLILSSTSTFQPSKLQNTSSAGLPGRSSLATTVPDDPIIDAPTPPFPISTFRPSASGELASLPVLSSVSLSDIPQLAFQKLKQCNRICDFSDPDVDRTSKVTKAAALTELIACYSNPRQFAKLTRECHQTVIEVFSVNVFRPLPKIPEALLDSIDAVIEETAWPHLRLTYRLFLQFLNCPIDQRLLQYHLTEQFFVSLFALLDFPDAREREEVKNVIVCIFQQVPPHRPTLRTITLNLLLCVSNSMLMTAASPLIDLLCFFTGDIPTMSPQMISAFERVVLPLHLPSRCMAYFDSLVRCTVMMVQKDVRLGSQLIQFLRAHWPMTLDHKAQLFIAEARRLLDESFDSVEADICDLLEYIGMAAQSPCTRLANTALDFLADNNFQNLYAKNPEPLLRLIFPAVYRIAEGHWQQNTQAKALAVMKSFLELNPDVFATVAGSFKKDVHAEGQRRISKRMAWERIAESAARIDGRMSAWGRRDIVAFFGGGRPRDTIVPASDSPEKISEEVEEIDLTPPEAEESEGEDVSSAILETVPEED